MSAAAIKRRTGPCIGPCLGTWVFLAATLVLLVFWVTLLLPSAAVDYLLLASGMLTGGKRATNKESAHAALHPPEAASEPGALL